MRWHEPDDARASSPESVRGSGCNSPGLLGLGAFSPGTILPSKMVAIWITADKSPPPVSVESPGYDPDRTLAGGADCVMVPHTTQPCTEAQNISEEAPGTPRKPPAQRVPEDRPGPKWPRPCPPGRVRGRFPRVRTTGSGRASLPR
jgi:hypothetical protein